MFLCNKLNLDKVLIIQKYCCHKVPIKISFFFVLHEVQQSDENVPFLFWDFLKV